jgi:hypothetical protein
MLGQLTKQMYTDYWLSALVAAGVDGSEVEAAEIDCRGYDRIRVLLCVGATATQNGTVKFYIKESATSGGTFTASTTKTIGTHTHGASAETAKIYELDVPVNIDKPFVKIAYQRETQNTAFLCGMYSLYNGKIVPITKATNIKEQVVL